MKNVNGADYSRSEFLDYKLRVKAAFYLGGSEPVSMDIYTTETEKGKILDALNLLKTEKVNKVEIIHIATKKDDDNASEFIDEVLNK